MTRPIRVLSISTLFPNTAQPGFGRFVARQFDALAARNEIDLTVICPVPRKAATGGARDYPVHYVRFGAIPFVGARWNPSLIARAVLPLARQLHAERSFDLVDAQFFYPDGPAAARVARDLGVPLSIKARGSDIHHWGNLVFARRIMRKAADEAAALLAVSEALRADMIALGMSPEKIAVHYTGLDHAIFRPRPRAKARAAIAHLAPIDGSLLVTTGNLIALKGQSLVIEALADLPGTRVLFAGSGPDRRVLNALAVNRGVGERVHFATLAPDEMALALAAADAMVLPSENEGLANAWIEALACGTPLVITAVGGAREVVTSPAAGRLIERTPAAIAAAVKDLLANPPSQAEVATHAARFSWEANAAQLAAHYARVAGVAPSRASRS